MQVMQDSSANFGLTNFGLKLTSASLLALLVIGLTGCQSLKSNPLFGNKDDIAATKVQQSEQAYYQEAKANLNKGNYSKAIANLNDLRTYYPVGAYSEQALLDLMYAYFQHGDYQDAVTSAKKFIELYPTNPQISYAYYVRGVANMHTASDNIMKYTKLNPAHRDVGYYRLAFNDFQELVSKYPNSAYAPDSALRMRYLYNQFAENEMEAARWYIKRKAYLASANRAKWVFQYYPQSLSTPEAIATLAYSYEKLGLIDTANQYKQLLKLNYPDLLAADGSVRLENTHTARNWLNKATLGLLGTSSDSVAINQDTIQDNNQIGNTQTDNMQDVTNLHLAPETSKTQETQDLPTKLPTTN
ncbi:DNA uptake lipoprotein-like protein [Moraxella macacae 0408225]|uniref:Outer membrane protein assembly factor BamD n=1 Tax=Moraxella macacae 0408225 TaxID=1230338 RepID=L2F5F9_9GAMM|nr:outer membrane protein assembly factor BamD [Moraxella macacae]ELA08262.1 DNA uptake lipoprotein-like protein [Moraxella macacae 0408225]